MPIPRDLHTDFFARWSPQMAYVLGFFAADGNMIRNTRGAHFVTFYSNDLLLLRTVRRTLGSTHKIAARKRHGSESTTYQMQLGSKRLFSDLAALGFAPRKSKRLRFPEIPTELLGDFVRGYFDGDGCVYFKRHYVKARNRRLWIFTSRFTCGSRRFLVLLQNALRSHGVKGGYIVTKWQNSGFELVFSHKDSLALYKLMYHNARDTDLRLLRKYALFSKAIRTLYPKMRV